MEPAIPMVEDAIPWSGSTVLVLQFLAEIGEILIWKIENKICLERRLTVLVPEHMF